MKKEIDLGYTFDKLKFFIEDICHGEDNDIEYEEVLSMFMSNFSGEELIMFREAQYKKTENGKH